ncbi:unnamed protein product [Aphanomyces euteiches]
MMNDEERDALEQEWAASVIQKTWKEFTDKQWLKWQQENAQEDSDDELIHALDSMLDGLANMSLESSQVATSTERTNLRQNCKSTPEGAEDGSHETELELVRMRLAADTKYQSLATKESVLDLQVNALLQQQQQLQLQQQRLQQLKHQKALDAKERKKQAKLRMQQCQEIEARRQEEVAKFRILENMHIIKDVGMEKPKREPRKTSPAAALPAFHDDDAVAPIVPLKKYNRLPDLPPPASKPPQHDAKDHAEKIKSSEKLTVSCYAQDLTPLVNGEKPKRVKVEPIKKAKAKPKKQAAASKVKLVKYDNQFDDLEPPPMISIPKATMTATFKPQVHAKYKVPATPLTAEIKHIAWASTYTKELETPLSTLQTDFETTFQSLLKPKATISPTTTLTTELETPLTTTNPIATTIQITQTSKQTPQMMPDASTISRRDYLLTKYGKPESFSGGSVPESPSVGIPDSQKSSSDGSDGSTWNYSSDRLQAILAKYKVATTATPPAETSTQTLIAKYATS